MSETTDEQAFTHQKTGFGQEFIYLVILLSSFFFGYYLSSSKVTPGKQRRNYSALFGLSLVLLTSGFQIGHSLTAFFIAYFIIYFGNKTGYTQKNAKSHSTIQWLVFTTNLLYLLFFRTCHDFFPENFNKISPFANVIQLITTLRIISYGFEYSDNKDFDPINGFYDFFTYNYAYIGLFSGPFYRKNVYEDFCNRKNCQEIDIKPHLIETLRPLPLTVIAYVILKSYMPVDFYRSDEFLNNSVWWNILILQVQFAWCRYRFYTAWMMAEATCITARLGAYRTERQARPGLGPKYAINEVEISNDSPAIYDFNTIWNLKKLVCEFHYSPRQCMRDWNCTVQWWLANYTYKKSPFSSIFARISFTMFISAYWHGIAPGYFMGFMCVPMITFTEDLLKKAFKYDFELVYKVLSQILGRVSFSMTGMAFLLLDFSTVIRVWKAAGFALFVLNFVLCVIAYLKIIVVPPPRRENKSGKAE